MNFIIKIWYETIVKGRIADLLMGWICIGGGSGFFSGD